MFADVQNTAVKSSWGFEEKQRKWLVDFRGRHHGVFARGMGGRSPDSDPHPRRQGSRDRRGRSARLLTPAATENQRPPAAASLASKTRTLVM